MRYVAARFIDLYRPGDVVPPGRYEPEALARMLERGQIVAVEDDRMDAVPSPAPEPEAQPVKAKRAKR